MTARRPFPSTPVLLAALVLLLLSHLPACSATGEGGGSAATADGDEAAATATAGAAAPAAAPAREAPVRDGLNERFLAPDLDVAQMVETFEGESREIAAERDALAATLQLGPGMTVADVGAGTGLFLSTLAGAVGPEGRVLALDISPAFVEHMRARAGREGLAQVEVRLCEDNSVGLPPASVDRAWICDTYHHFEYPRSTLASLFSAIKPGGLLVVVDFERIEGVSREWVLSHVRAGKEVFRAEIEEAGFVLVDEPLLPGLEENYVLRFRRP